ncbi:hypothetical protein [Campylobacter volucris]|uniref:hypothetical protein n=1 Tax=Campylobacter volucris TaxID=1031542 RepID=UPI00189CB7AE|nr:hypothetical protein [Campylobacter volucris]MBF7068798.1 hypothetical protein [Campylobacter volucris]
MIEILDNPQKIIFNKKTFKILTYDDYIKKLDKNYKIKLFFPSCIQSFVAFKILLFKLFKKFQIRKNIFLEKTTFKKFKKLYKALYQINIFFMVFEDMFEQDIQKKLQEDLCDLETKIDLYKDEVNFKQCVDLLHCKNSKNLFLNIEIILKDNSDFFKQNNELNLKQAITLLLEKQMLGLEKIPKKSLENFIEFDKINFLFKHFSYVLKKADFKKIQIVLKDKTLKNKKY